MKQVLGIFICFLLAASCSHASHPFAVVPSICFADLSASASPAIDKVTVFVTLDQHGGFAVAKHCPQRVFSIDFSGSELFTKSYSALLDQMQMGSMRSGSPTEITISGSLRKKSASELRDTILVGKIIDYRLPQGGCTNYLQHILEKNAEIEAESVALSSSPYILGVQGYTTVFPGAENSAFTHKLRLELIDGTSDSNLDASCILYQREATHYAQRFNQRLLRLLQEKEKQ